VEERAPRTVQVGLGYGTSEKVRARVSWLHRNLLGSGRKLELSARHSSLETGVLAGLDWPHAFGSDVAGQITANLFREQIPTYEARRAQLEASIALPLNTWKGRLAYRIDRSRTSSVADATERALDGTQQNTVVGMLETRLENSTAEPAEDPRGGWRAELRSGMATRAFGSEVDFARVEGDLRGYWSVLDAVAAVRVRAGVIQPLASFSPDDIPLTERFYAGGGESVRGFDYQRLGPLDSGENPLGGTTVLVGSTELRVPVRDKLGAVVFVDAGLIDRDPFNFSSELRYSAGVGLRLATPVGPVRVDLAQLLNPPDDFQRFRVHLSIGQAF
jgi:outer membrane protein insertion porin family/translocation and assembly module TamA